MTEHRIGTREEWQAERGELLREEKELTRRNDELALKRQALPWVPYEADHRFETEAGPRSLAELFDGRPQLLIYHFMFGPDYNAGCPTCSSIADGIDPQIPHLNARDSTMICVSSAPIEKLAAFKRRMGWRFEWASAPEFNADFAFSLPELQVRENLGPVLENPPPGLTQNAEATGTDPVGYASQGFGFTAFVSDGDAIYQTYSTTGRGVEFLMGYYEILDRTAKGRDEGDAPQTWIRRHDEY